MLSPGLLKRAIMVTCLLASFFGGVSELGASTWPTFMADAINSGVSASTGPSAADELYHYDLPVVGANSTSPVVAHEKVYVVAVDSLYCLSAYDDSLLWVQSVGDTTRSSPTVSGCKVYVLSGNDDRRVWAFNASNGNLLWRSSALGTTWNDPVSGNYWHWSGSCTVVGDSCVYVGARNGTVYCLRTSGCAGGSVLDGSVKWQTNVSDGYIVSTPAVRDSFLVAGAYLHGSTNNEEGIYCLDARNGAVLWHYYHQNTNDRGVHSSATITEDYDVFIGSNAQFQDPIPPYTNYDGAVYRFSADYTSNGSPPWFQNYGARMGIGCVVYATPAYCDDTLFVATGYGLYCLDTSLSTVWSKWTGGAIEMYGSVAVSDPSGGMKRLYVDGVDGLYCLEPSTGETLWAANASGQSDGSPAIAYENVYWVSSTGRLHCYGQNQ